MDVFSPRTAISRAGRFISEVLVPEDETNTVEGAKSPKSTRNGLHNNHREMIHDDLGQPGSSSCATSPVMTSYEDSQMVVLSVNEDAFESLFVPHRAPSPIRYEEEPTAADTDDTDSTTRMRKHMTHAWNKLKYGWTWKKYSSFHAEHPIWLLGRMYRAFDEDDDRPLTPFTSDDRSSFGEFQVDFVSRPWFTYRTDFPPIGTSSMTSDCGWGCMLRSGQMMLAHALTLHLLGRDWNLRSASAIDDLHHRRVLSYFNDKITSPLSIHQLVELAGTNHDKVVGDWYGPASVASLIRDVFCSQQCQRDSVLSQLAVYVSRDCTVFKRDVDVLCGAVDNQHGDTTWVKSLLLLIPLRLGCERVNDVYAHHLQTLFSLEHCIGVIGGKPKHGMYFVGWHKRSVLYLDPHYSQKCADMDEMDFSLKSYHCRWPRKIRFDDIDPSSCVGFYCKTKADFDELTPALRDIAEVDSQVNGTLRPRHALFSIVDSSHANVHSHSEHASMRRSMHSEPVISHGFELL